MSLTKMKKVKLLALFVVFTMLFSYSVALGNNAGGNGNGQGEIHADSNPSTV